MNAIVERGSNGMGARAATTRGASRLLEDPREDPRDRREFRRESRRSYSRFSRSTLAMRSELPSIQRLMRASHSSRGPPISAMRQPRAARATGVVRDSIRLLMC